MAGDHEPMIEAPRGQTRDSSLGFASRFGVSFSRGNDLFAQVGLVIASWAILCGLHWHNNGLWYPGDAPRHLANGLFLRDYLEAGLPGPIGYYRGYLIRYPIIDPTKYPPAFYILEATAFALFRPTPFVAKGLVLSFALVAALYHVRWLRRFVAPGAGYLAAMLPLLPCFVRYSHAIMLNIPACALQVAALFHTRRWLEEQKPSQLVLAVVLGLSALFCYQGAYVLLLVAGCWIIVSGRWKRLLDRRALVVALAAGLPALAWLIVWLRWSPGQVRWLFDTPYIGHLVNWLWYPIRMPGEFGPIVIALAGIGAAAGLLGNRFRREVLFSGTWIVVTYLFHSYLFGKDVRYIAPLATPILSLAAVGLWPLVEAIAKHLGRSWNRPIGFAALFALLAAQTMFASQVSLPNVRGFELIVEEIRNARQEDQESILLDVGGVNAAVFTCQVMLDDRQFRLRTPTFDWLLAYAQVKEPSELTGGGLSEREAMETLLAHSGCQWIVVPIHESNTTPMSRLLHETLLTSRFRFIGSFAVDGPDPVVLGLYRQIKPIGRLTDLRERFESRSSSMDWITRQPVMR